MAHSVEWAPDGESLAFVGWNGAYVVDRGGGEVRRIFEGDVNDVTWAPNGRHVALVALERSGDGPAAGFHDVHVVEVATLEARELGSSPADDVDPAWSPDGERLAFSSSRAGSYDLYVVGRDGRGLRRLTRGPARETAPAWAPDGRAIVFRREGGSRVPFSGGPESIVLVDTDGLREHVLVSMSPRRSLDRCCWRPRWSPDGRRIAVDLGASIRVVSVPTGRSEVLAARGTGPLWSPDGTRILFDGWKPYDCSGVVGLCIDVSVTGPWVVSAGGGLASSLVRRAKLPSVVTVGGSWSPSGRTIALVLDVDGERSIVLVHADGSTFRELELGDVVTS